MPRSKGVTVPGGGWRYAKGWVAAPARLVTVAGVVADWPQGPDDRIEVLDSDGRVYVAAVGLLESALGLAVLDVVGLKPPPGQPEPLLDKGAIYGGATLFGAGEGGLLARYPVRGPAQGAFAFYWVLDGTGLLGTPLVTRKGRLVSLIGAMDPQQVGRSLALPTRALKRLFERSAEWQP